MYIYLNHGNYTYTDLNSSATIYINLNCIIDGQGATIDASGASFPVFKINTSSVTFKNLIIKNAGSSAIDCDENVADRCTIDNVRFINNTATMGGAIYYDSNNLTVKNCYFQYNYANSNMKLVKKNPKLHNPDSPLLIGEVKDEDVVNEVNEPSYIDYQQKLF